MASKEKPKKQRRYDIKTTQPSKEERETDFGTDRDVPQKLSQGASPNPEHRRPVTIKRMKHKVFKTLGLERGSSATQAVADDQESTKDDDTKSSNMITPLKVSPGNERKHLAMPSSAELISEPTLVADKSISRNDDDVRQEDGVQVMTDHPLLLDETRSCFKLSSPSAAFNENIEPIGSYVSEDMKERHTIGGQVPEPSTRDEHARHKSSQAKNFKLVPKLRAETKKLSSDLQSAQYEIRQKQSAVEELQEMLSSKSKDLEELKAELDKRDLDHERHITEKVNELKAMHQQREKSLDYLLKQEKQTHSQQLKDMEKKNRNSLDEKEKSFAGLLEKEQKERQVEFERKEVLAKDKYETAVKDTVVKEKEVQILQLIIQEKQQELTFNKQEKDKLQREVDATKQQQEEFKKQTTKKISGLEQKLHEELERQIEENQEQLNSQHQHQVLCLEMQAKAQLDEAKAQLDEANAQIKRLKEELHIQVQENKTQTHGASSTVDEVIEGIELEKLAVVLNEQRQEQHCLLESKENNDLHSSFVEATNQIAKIVNSEAIFGVAKERDITRDASMTVAKTLGLGEQPKPLSYVFAVFPANQRKLSVLLDYTEQKEVKDADEYLSVINQKALETYDNRTDAEKLRGELEELTKKAEFEAEVYQQKVDKLEVQAKELTKKVSEISATNAHLQEVVKTALEETPPSASGIQAGDVGKTAKMLQQIRAKYLELSMQVVTTREDHEKQIEEYKVKLTEWQKRYNRKKQELTEKIIEKDNQLKQQCRDDGPPTTSFSSAEFHTPSKEISKQVEELSATLKIRDEEVQSLNAKVEAFQEVASQRQKLIEHSRTQSTVVAQLRKDLEESKNELTVLRSKSESAKMIGDLHKKLIEVLEELNAVKKEKSEVEDELLLLKNEFESEKQNHLSQMHELARSQSLVESLRTKAKPLQLGTDDQDELKLLRAEAKLFQIELAEHRRKAESSKKFITSLGRLKVSLERKLKQSNEEREELAQKNMELRTSKHTMQGQLNKIGDLKTQVEATQGNLAELVQTVVSKTEENEDLKRKIKELGDELEASKFQAYQYEQDFKEERQAREQAIGARDDDFCKFSLQVQTLERQLNDERKEKQAVIRKLEECLAESQKLNSQIEQTQRDFSHALKTHSETLESMEAEKQQLNRQLEQAERDFNHTLEAKSEELESIKTQLTNQLHHIKSEATKYQEQLQRAEEVYLQRQNELLDQIETLRDDAAKQQSELQDKAQIAVAQNLSLNNQLEKTKIEIKAKEKNLEIMATEKQILEENLRMEKEHNAALNQELSKTKANGDRIAKELQDSHQRLETSVADIACLHDEVLAKTAQVKQYKEQMDNFKLEVEEANGRLVKTQRELQRCQTLMTKMEKDMQDQFEPEENKRKESGDHFTGLLLEGEQWLKRIAKEQEVMQSAHEQDLLTMKKRLEQEELRYCHALSYLKIVSRQLKQVQNLPGNIQGHPSLHFNSDIPSQHRIKLNFPLQFDKKIARGSFGEIYAIEYNNFPCIAKRLLDILMGRGGHEEVSEECKRKYHETFYRECVLLSQMKHDNIVQFIGVHCGKERYDLTLILERLTTDLDRYLESSKVITLFNKLKILSDISCGLLYLHERSVVHRDLSAANILLTDDLRAKIADLGVSKIVDDSVLRLTTAPGTQPYMSPEALAGEKYNSSLDIFSFGVIALYIAVQEFPKLSWAHVPDAVIARGEGEVAKRKSWIDLMEQRQPQLSVIVLWCLSDDPSHRPTTKCLNIVMQKDLKALPTN